MRKVIFLISISILTFSCATINPLPTYDVKIQKVKGNYTTPFIVNKNVDYVWEKIIDYFSKNGVSIKLIDKQSGLIISNTLPFDDNYRYTYEKDSSILEDANAFFVFDKEIFNNNIYTISNIKGEWNVRIKQDDKNINNTIIFVNITNLKGTGNCIVYQKGTSFLNPDFSFPLIKEMNGKSTGVFEKFFLRNILN